MSWRFLVVLSLGWSLLSSARAADPKGVQPIHLGVNTEADEDEPFLSSSSLRLFYCSNAKDKKKMDIMMSQRGGTTRPWPRGNILEGYVRTPADDRSVFVTRDARFPQFLYYATRKDKEANNYDIYVAIRQDREAVFSEPTPVQAIDTEADELHPWLTADGKQLYFSRKTTEGWRVFVARRPSVSGPQGFGAPEMVKDLPPDYCHATLPPDGKTMYMQGPLEEGRLGLFRSTLAGKTWSKPEALDMLNSREAPKGDRSPSLSQDGRLLYFASDRPGGKGGLDLWAVPTAQLVGKK
jgi:hypothetical protein